MQNNSPLKFGGCFPPFPLKVGHRHLEEVEKLLQRRIDIALWYQWWGTNWMIGRAAQDFQAKWVKEAGDRDILIKWDPWTPGRQIEQPKFAVQTIINGAHDSYLHRWAQRIRDYGRTIYLCPMTEPNGFWNQWSSVVGKHSPLAYIAAWHHIHGVFQQVAVTNVKWVWNPNAGDSPAENRMEDYYPGSDYVDILGLSVYNWGTARSWSHWRSFAEIIQPYYDRIGTLESQPIWIAEMACAPEGGDRAAWIQAMLEYLPALPRLETLLWFNTKKETDWRITNDPHIVRQFWST